MTYLIFMRWSFSIVRFGFRELWLLPIARERVSWRFAYRRGVFIWTRIWHQRNRILLLLIQWLHKYADIWSDVWTRRQVFSWLSANRLKLSETAKLNDKVLKILNPCSFNIIFFAFCGSTKINLYLRVSNSYGVNAYCDNI